MRDSHLTGFYHRMLEEGAMARINIEGSINSEAQFVAAAKAAFVFAEIMDGGDSLGIVWLNRYEHRRAHLHYCLWKRYFGPVAIEISKDVISKMFELSFSDGSPVLDCIWGVTPASNRLAVNFNIRAGATMSGVIRNYIWDDSAKKSINGYIFHFTREMPQ